MKSKKALKRLNKVESPLSRVIDNEYAWYRRGQHSGFLWQCV